MSIFGSTDKRTGHAAAERGPPPGEFPPDGDEVLSEWQEGPHTVIERRGGPGEDVDVEVLRHTHDEESVPGKMKHAEEKVEQAIHRHSPTHHKDKSGGKGSGKA
ncbi:hypothetical protein EV714DRAFT_267693 [Schizophyllum commune]